MHHSDRRIGEHLRQRGLARRYVGKLGGICQPPAKDPAVGRVGTQHPALAGEVGRKPGADWT